MVEQEREAVTARLKQAQQVVEQAREEMRSHVEQDQQTCTSGKREGRVRKTGCESTIKQRENV